MIDLNQKLEEHILFVHQIHKSKYQLIFHYFRVDNHNKTYVFLNVGR